MLNRRVLAKTLAVLLLPFVLPLGGCTYSGTVGASYNTQTGATTVSGSVTISSKAVANSIGTADLSSAINSGYTVTFAIPTAELTPALSNPVQATLTGTTDTGFTASITETLTPAGSAPDSTYSGYTDYSYTMPSSQNLTDWVNSLNLNAINNATVVTTTNGIFAPAGTTGTYQVYVMLTSTQTGTVPGGSAVFTDPGRPKTSGPGCLHKGTCLNQP